MECTMLPPRINQFLNMPPSHGVMEPGSNDILCGRGVKTNRHIGNQKFRQLVDKNKRLYVSSTKKGKMNISRSIVKTVREEWNPRGRFLEKDPSSLVWIEIGDKKAIEKTAQALRDVAAQHRKQLSKDMSDQDIFSAVFDKAPANSETTQASVRGERCSSVKENYSGVHNVFDQNKVSPLDTSESRTMPRYKSDQDVFAAVFENGALECAPTNAKSPVWDAGHSSSSTKENFHSDPILFEERDKCEPLGTTDFSARASFPMHRPKRGHRRTRSEGFGNVPDILEQEILSPVITPMVGLNELSSECERDCEEKQHNFSNRMTHKPKRSHRRNMSAPQISSLVFTIGDQPSFKRRRSSINSTAETEDMSSYGTNHSSYVRLEGTRIDVMDENSYGRAVSDLGSEVYENDQDFDAFCPPLPIIKHGRGHRRVVSDIGANTCGTDQKFLDDLFAPSQNIVPGDIGSEVSLSMEDGKNLSELLQDVPREKQLGGRMKRRASWGDLHDANTTPEDAFGLTFEPLEDVSDAFDFPTDPCANPVFD